MVFLPYDQEEAETLPCLYYAILTMCVTRYLKDPKRGLQLVSERPKYTD